MRKRLSFAIVAVLVTLLSVSVLTSLAQDGEVTPTPTMASAVESAASNPSSAGAVFDVDLAQVSGLQGLNVYFSESNGEASRFDRSENGISRFAGFLNQSGANLFTLEWRTSFSRDIDLLIIASPTQELSLAQTVRLFTYLGQGGKLLLITDNVAPDGNVNSRGLTSNGNTFSILYNTFGLRGRDDVLIEPTGSTVERVVRFRIDRNTVEDRLVEVPIVNTRFTTEAFNTEHPITNDLDGSLHYETARSIDFDSVFQDFTVSPLVFDGSADIYGESNWNRYFIQQFSEFNVEEDTTQGNLIIAAAYQDPDDARIVLLGDSNIVTNGSGFQSSPSYSSNFVFPTNIQFMLNVTAWLVGGETAQLDLPAPFPTSTPTNTATPTVTPTPEPTEASEANTGN